MRLQGEHNCSAQQPPLPVHSLRRSETHKGAYSRQRTQPYCSKLSWTLPWIVCWGLQWLPLVPPWRPFKMHTSKRTEGGESSNLCDSACAYSGSKMQQRCLLGSKRRSLQWGLHHTSRPLPCFSCVFYLSCSFVQVPWYVFVPELFFKTQPSFLPLKREGSGGQLKTRSKFPPCSIVGSE